MSQQYQHTGIMKRLQSATTTLLLLLFTLAETGCLQKFDNYGVVDTIVCNEDNSTVTVLVAENNATSYQQNGGYIRTTYHTTYWLKQYENATGKLLKKKKIFKPSDADKLSIRCYGRHNNKIWMHINGLTAYDIRTLEEVSNEEGIAAANGVKLTIFPADDRLITPHIKKGCIDFIADNGEAYRLRLQDEKIINRDTYADETEETENKISRFLQDDVYGTRCDTFQQKIFAFAKNEEDAKSCRPGNTDIAERAYRMKLFISGYSLHKLGMHNSFAFENIQEVATETYLNPCFARDTYSGNTIHLSQPDGYLVIQQDVLGEKSKALITRIDCSGKKIWEKSCGVSTKISGCTKEGKYLFLSTNKNYMLSSFIGKDALCIIDTENGNIITPSLKD